MGGEPTPKWGGPQVCFVSSRPVSKGADGFSGPPPVGAGCGRLGLGTTLGGGALHAAERIHSFCSSDLIFFFFFLKLSFWFLLLSSSAFLFFLFFLFFSFFGRAPP